MEPDTIFRLYSMTKPIAATALMTLYEEGKFQLDDPIAKYIPEFKGARVLRTPESPLTDTVPAVRELTIHDLFRHTGGLKHGGDAYEKENLFGLDTSLAEMITRLAKIPLYYQPGTHFEYSVAGCAGKTSGDLRRHAFWAISSTTAFRAIGHERQRLLGQGPFPPICRPLDERQHACPM
jgi:hypothetical protein